MIFTMHQRPSTGNVGSKRKLNHSPYLINVNILAPNGGKVTANSSSRAYLNSNSNNVPQDTTSNFFVFQNKVSSRPSLNNTNRSARATAFDVNKRRISGHTTKHAWNASTKAINSSGTVTQNLFGGPQFVKAKGPI